MMDDEPIEIMLKVTDKTFGDNPAQGVINQMIRNAYAQTRGYNLVVQMLENERDEFKAKVAEFQNMPSVVTELQDRVVLLERHIAKIGVTNK